MTVRIKAGSLDTIAVAEQNEGGGYEWSAIGVFRDRATGKLYWSEDSGCSCFGPFDSPNWAPGDHEDVVEPLPETLDDFRRALDALTEISADERREVLLAAGIGSA